MRCTCLLLTQGGHQPAQGTHGTGRAIVRWDFVLMLSFMRLLVLGENVG